MLCGFALVWFAALPAVAPVALAGDSGGELAAAPSAERWAVSPLILRVQPALDAGPFAMSDHLRDDPQRAPVLWLAMVATILLAMSLLELAMFALFQVVTLSRAAVRAAPAASPSRPLSEADYEVKCQQLFQSVTALWARAETSVFDLDEALPLRALLFKELDQISKRLSMDSSLRLATTGALTARHDQPYWRALSQRLNQSARDLTRIAAVAEAAGAGFGSRSSEPRIPKSRDEACFILGANREADADTLQRLVKALRQCWHPDLAQTEHDRRHREARLKQINAAHDLITGKRVEG